MIDEIAVAKIEAFIQAEFMSAKPGYIWEESEVGMGELYVMTRAFGSPEQAIQDVVRTQLGRLCRRFVRDQLAAPGRPSVSVKLEERRGHETLVVRTEMPTMATDPLVVPDLQQRLDCLTRRAADVAKRLEHTTSLHSVIHELRAACEEAAR